MVRNKKEYNNNKAAFFFLNFEHEDKKLNKKIKLCDPSLTTLENHCKSLNLVQLKLLQIYS